MTTFFFTSFPDDSRAKEMYEDFKSFQYIDEVVIPAKVQGIRYGDACDQVRQYILNKPDCFERELNDSKCFSIKSCYTLLDQEQQGIVIDEVLSEALSKLWKSKISSKF